MGLTHSPLIPTDGLLMSIDAANPRCYPGTGTSVDDLLIPASPVNQPIKLRKNSGASTDNDMPHIPVVGTINGASFSSDNGGQFVFDGTDDYIEFDSETLSPFYPAGMLCWFKLNSVAAAQGVISMAYHASKYYGYIVNVNASAVLSMHIGDGGSAGSGARRTGVGPTITTGKWYHIGCVWNALVEDMVMYLNGDPITLTYSGTGDKIFYGNVDGRATRMGVLNAKYLNGCIAQHLFYGRALTVTEILNHYAATKGRFE